METFPVVTLPDPRLRQRSRELTVEEILTPEFQLYLDELAATMLVSHGVGIASPQVGKNIRAIVINVADKDEWFINPEIIKTSDAMVESEEGCLSVPGEWGIVNRHKKVTFQALTRHGRRVQGEAKGMQAIVLQHEIDHLDGILFIDKAIRMLKKTAKTHL
ncbi:MAG: peptide deformylase [Patescibacteria group bacterium]